MWLCVVLFIESWQQWINPDSSRQQCNKPKSHTFHKTRWINTRKKYNTSFLASLVSVKAVLDWEESFEKYVFTVQWPLIHSSKDQGKFDISAHRQYFDSIFHYQDQYIKILLKMSFINSVVRLLHNVYIDSLFQPCGKSLSRCYQRGSQVNDSIEAGIMLEECQDLFSFSLSQCVCCQG